MSETLRRAPVVYIPHGGGPWPFVDTPFGERRELDALSSYLRSLPSLYPARAILSVTAHWEEDAPTVSSHPNPPLLFDYYGFPPESYQLTWPAPGDPSLATRVRELLAAAGIAATSDA